MTQRRTAKNTAADKTEGGPLVVTGLDSALVNLGQTSKGTFNLQRVRQGETLPDGVPAEEVERLRALGAFRPGPTRRRAARKTRSEADRQTESAAVARQAKSIARQAAAIDREDPTAGIEDLGEA